MRLVLGEGNRFLLQIQKIEKFAIFVVLFAELGGVDGNIRGGGILGLDRLNPKIATEIFGGCSKFGGHGRIKFGTVAAGAHQLIHGLDNGLIERRFVHRSTLKLKIVIISPDNLLNRSLLWLFHQSEAKISSHCSLLRMIDNQTIGCGSSPGFSDGSIITAVASLQ
ncbi:MAG: hypothetical protein ACR2Q4_00360 [Geminicoccaceae bacterium]